MLQAGRRRGWGGFYQAKPSLVVAASEGRGEVEQQRTTSSSLAMDQKKTCRELLEERQMRRYWRAQRRAFKKGGTRSFGGAADENWRKRGDGRGWRGEVTNKIAQPVAQRRIETAAKRKPQSQKTGLVENGKETKRKQEQKCELENGDKGFNDATFWKDPLPEISCEDLDLLSGDSSETSDEDPEEVVEHFALTLRIEDDGHKLLHNKEKDKEEEEEVEEEEERPLLFLTQETACTVRTGIHDLEKKTIMVGMEAEQVALRVKRLQERLANLESQKAIQ